MYVYIYICMCIYIHITMIFVFISMNTHERYEQPIWTYIHIYIWYEISHGESFHHWKKLKVYMYIYIYVYIHIFIATYKIKYNNIVLYTVYTYWDKTDENTCWCSHHCRRGRDVGLRPAPRALGRLGPAKKRSPGLEMKRMGDFNSSMGMGQN